ncbi:terminase large subunit domain-containing protein [Cryptosporangium sp. NPDC051539]|uniref:terminase large subunit domain-containing protein n=1 Tax=Cryptosporangium sp. NPDC051539 TaxID=3363962 RepID=UPI0037AFD79C
MLPWQRYVSDVAYEINPWTGRLVYREIVVTVPRQSGKTTLILPVEVHRALAFPTITGDRQTILYGAQTGKDARIKWEDEHLYLLDKSPYARLYRKRLVNGREAILWNNGSVHGIVAGTEKAGHGPTLDLGVQDEAFALIDGRAEQAMKPAMNTRLDPQFWVTSTAGTAKSLYLLDKVEIGRAAVEGGVTDGIAYFEWSADPEADPGDPATWHSCMPALGVLGATTEAVVRAAYLSMKRPEFRRAFLNIADTEAEAESVIEAEVWQSLADEDSRIVGQVAIAADMTPERSYGSIAIAGLNDQGQLHVELVDHRPGTGWMKNCIADLAEARQPVALIVDPAGPAGSLIPDLTARGLELVTPSAREAAQAAGDFYEACVETGDLRHIDQAQLNAAVAAGQKRPLGDAWAWARASMSADISPLVAVTLASWGWTKFGHEEPYDPLNNIW